MTLGELTNVIGFKVNQSDVNNVNNTFKSIGNTAKKLLGAIGIGFSLVQLNAIAEEFDQIGDRISYAAEGAENLDEIQHQILDSANACRTSYGSFANEVTSLKQANAEVFPLEDAAKFVEYINKLGKAAGYSDGEISTMQSSIQRMVASGQAGAGDITRILRTAPALAEQLAKGLGTNIDGLVQMAEQGEITAETLKEAMINSTDDIDAAFGNLNFGVGDALLQIRNKFGFWVDETNKMFNITQSLGRLMVSVFNRIMSVLNRARSVAKHFADSLGGVENAIRLVAIAAGLVFVAMNAGKILTFLEGARKLLTAINFSMLRTIAVFLLIALIIEDLVGFMQGRDSLFGELLKKSGVDVEQFRTNLITIWGKIKTALAAIWQGIKNVGIPIFQGLWQGILTIFGKIGDLIKTIAPGFADFIDRLANGEVDTQTWQKVGEVIAQVAAGIIGAIAVFKTLNTVTKAVTSVFNLLGSPIGRIILIIGALIAVVILIIKNWDKIKAAFLSAWEAIRSAWSKVVGFFTNIWNGIVGVFNSVVSFFSNIFSSAWEGIKSVWTGVSNFFGGIWDSIVGAFDSVVTWFTEIFAQAWQGIQDVFSGVTEFFQGVWDTIVALFTTIGTAVGDAISGAVKGAVNAILSGATSIINGFIDAINFAIGVINLIPGVSIGLIGRLSAPQLAEGGFVKANDPQAVIVGDNKREGEIVSPVSKMRDTVLDALNMFVSSVRPSASAETLSSVTTNRNIVQNVSISNTFNGDKAIQKKASQAMGKAADDITSQLARGLAYAR